MHASLKKVLETLKELWFVPFIVYFLGFVYVQGLFAPFYENTFIFNHYLRAQPLSPSLYLVNGIYLAFTISASFLFAKWADRLFKVNIHLQRAIQRGKWVSRACVLGGFLLLVLLFYLQSAMILHGWGRSWIPLITYFLYYIVFFAVVGFMSRSARYAFPSKSMMYNVPIYFVAAICFTLSLYLFGLDMQSKEVYRFAHQKDTLEMARITADEGSPHTYVKMDLSSEFFIGYDIGEKKTVHIPKDRIVEIQTFQARNYGSKARFLREELPSDSDARRMADVLQAYYDILTSQSLNLENVNRLQQLLGDNFRIKRGFEVSAPILLKILQNENYRDRPKSEFFGVEMSLPEPMGEGRDAAHRVFVKEYWKGETFDLVYTLQHPELTPPGADRPWVITDVQEALFYFL